MERSLMHFGVLGMRWGVRRDRSSGGSTKSADHERAAAIKRKKLSEMSNEEIKDLTNRLQLEKQYKELSKSQMSAGEKFIKDQASQMLVKYLSSGRVFSDAQKVKKAIYG